MPHERTPDTGPANRSSKLLLLVMLAIIVAGIAAFLVLRPNPSGAPTNGTPGHQQ